MGYYTGPKQDYPVEFDKFDILIFFFPLIIGIWIGFRYKATHIVERVEGSATGRLAGNANVKPVGKAAETAEIKITIQRKTKAILLMILIPASLLPFAISTQFVRNPVNSGYFRITFADTKSMGDGIAFGSGSNDTVEITWPDLKERGLFEPNFLPFRSAGDFYWKILQGAPNGFFSDGQTNAHFSEIQISNNYSQGFTVTPFGPALSIKNEAGDFGGANELVFTQKFNKNKFSLVNEGHVRLSISYANKKWIANDAPVFQLELYNETGLFHSVSINKTLVPNTLHEIIETLSSTNLTRYEILVNSSVIAQLDVFEIGLLGDISGYRGEINGNIPSSDGIYANLEDAMYFNDGHFVNDEISLNFGGLILILRKDLIETTEIRDQRGFFTISPPLAAINELDEVVLTHLVINCNFDFAINQITINDEVDQNCQVDYEYIDEQPNKFAIVKIGADLRQYTEFTMVISYLLINSANILFYGLWIRNEWYNLFDGD
jgi:hypothetical protein